MEENNERQQLLELLRAGQPHHPSDVDTSTVRYALYARKSTTSEDKQASSIPDQIRDCMERVVSVDASNPLNVVKVYQESWSAKVADTREEFKAMIRDIELGRIDGVIAWHPDRLSRNMKEAGAIIDLVDRGLIRDLKFATFTFENTPAGKMLLGITFVMAKQYSEHLSESVDRGNARAIEDGEFLGKFKHGYIIDSNRFFQPDPVNFTKIKHMFDMALSGKSQKDIRLWINEQGYTVQKRQGAEPVPHIWDKDDVSKLLKSPHYAGIHEWGKNYVDLVESYDFTPMITVQEFLQINKINSLSSSKVSARQRPRGGTVGADLLRGRVYCGHCQQTLTSMLIPKRDKDGNIIHSRYYYKCETLGCELEGKSARAGLVVDSAQDFFAKYLFVTKNNYSEFKKQAKKTIAARSAEFESNLARLKTTVANKERSYEQTKELIRNNPDLKEHYDLDKYAKEVKKLKDDYKKNERLRDSVKDSIPTYEQYLKLFESTPVILGKIRDMKAMDALLRIFFSNFTITATNGDFRKGSKVSYKLNEPYNGFIESGDFVLGAGQGTLTPGLILGKDAL
jgi:DNA invertase Pin-like site-specific DNA recombinase